MTETPIIDVLCAIEKYNSSHNAASTAYKSTLWNLSKARRQKGALGSGYSYCASDVREELRAFATLENSEHDLVDEECTKGTSDMSRNSYSFVLTYADKAKKKKEEIAQEGTTNEETGLRRRKGKSETTTSPSPWVEESAVLEEEERLRTQDPIALFGALPPRDLKIAQIKAKEMLQQYVKAANEARAIMNLIAKHESS